MDKQKILRSKPSKEFWITNIAGWSITAVVNTALQYFAVTKDIKMALWGIVPILTCFVFTTLLRYYWGRTDIYSHAAGKLLLLLIPQSFIVTLLIDIFGIGSLLLIHPLPGGGWRMLIGNFISIIPILWLWIALYFVVVYYQTMRRREIDNLRLENSLQNAMLSNLRNQLNPHFLFNALNNIRSLIREDAECARTMITSLTDILRYSLKSQSEQKVLLSEEISFIKEYLKLEHLHMENRLKYKIEIDESVSNTLLPPMTIQLLVENSIKHGISKITEGGELSIKVYMNEGCLKITVANTGRLTDDSAEETQGVGLKNLRERISLLYRKNSGFEIKQENDFVVATVTMPVEVKDESAHS